MDPYVAFLSDKTLLKDAKEAKKVQRMATRFWLSDDGRLFRRSFGGPYLLCFHPSKTTELLVKLHEGLCCSHSRGRLLRHRAITQGLWWPNMQREEVE